MVYIFQIVSVLSLVLSCNAYVNSNCEFCPPDEDTVLLHIGSQLRSLGIPEFKITENFMRTGGSWYMGFGDHRYFRITFSRHGRVKFISKVDFNIMGVQGMFKGKEGQVGSDEQGGIPLENFGDDPIELEGTLVFENSDCNSCHDNATIQIKITPKRENVDLELHLDRSFGPVLENFGFSIAPFFMDLKKVTALLKVSIPFGYRIPFNLGVRRDAYTKNVYDPSGSCTANLELKLMGGIPTVFPNSGPKKPGVYIFSASAKIAGFNRPKSYDIFRSRSKVDVNDQVVFEDNQIHNPFESENLDKTFTFDVTMDFNDYDVGKEFINMKITDVNTGMHYGQLATLVSKDHLRIEFDTFDRMLHGYISKLSLNARKYSNQTMESLEIYLETNAYGPDSVECDARLAKAIIGKHKLLKLNDKAKPNTCNKYMIYERQSLKRPWDYPEAKSQTLTRVYLEPLFALGLEYNRKNRSLFYEERTYVLDGPEPNDRSYEVQTTFADALGNHDGRLNNLIGVKINTEFYSEYYYNESSLQIHVTTLHGFPSQDIKLGSLELWLDDYKNTCSVIIVKGDEYDSASDQMFDGTLFNCTFEHIVNEIMRRYTDYTSPLMMAINNSRSPFSGLWFPQKGNFTILT